MIHPKISQAVAPPITLDETQNVGAQMLRKFRPKPPRLLRQKLNLDFAVLLMRSSYAVTGMYICMCMYFFGWFGICVCPHTRANSPLIPFP